MKELIGVKFEKFILFTKELTDEQLFNLLEKDDVFIEQPANKEYIRYDGVNYYINEWVEYKVISYNDFPFSKSDNFFHGKYIYKNVGILQVNNFIGEIKFMNQVFIVESKKISTKDYYYQLNDIDNRISDALSLVFRSTAITRGDFENNPEINREYHKFVKIYNLLERDQVFPYTHYIRKNTNTSFKKRIIRNDISKVRQTTTKSIVDIFQGKNNLVKSSSGKMMSNLNGLIPTDMNEYYYLNSSDNYENQFIKFFLKYLLKTLNVHLKEISILVDRELHQTQLNIALITNIEKMKKDILVELDQPFYSNISDLRHISKSNSVLTRQYGYRNIYNIYRDLSSAPKNFFESKSLIELYESKSVDKLYEYICLFRLIDLLSSIFNQEIIEKEIIPLRDHQETVYTITLGEKAGDVNINFGENQNYYGARLLFQHSFTRGNNTSNSVNFAPDFSLEVFMSENNSHFYHFDAKFKKLGNERAKTEDIQKMHSYRDGIKDTVGAFILYPGKHTTIYIIDKNVSYSGVGAFPLNYDKMEDNDLYKAIKKIVSK